MSKLYKKYVELKNNDENKLYLIKSGIFYLFLDKDAKIVSKELDLKLTPLNNDIVKCGFPTNSLNKYLELLKEFDICIVDDILINNKDEYLKNKKVTNILKHIKKLDINKIKPIDSLKTLEQLVGVLNE